MRVLRKSKTAAVTVKQTPAGKTEVCKEELAALCILSASGDFCLR